MQQLDLDGIPVRFLWANEIVVDHGITSYDARNHFLLLNGNMLFIKYYVMYVINNKYCE